ncbi:hypothetical protein RB596_004421 [Gaeumannomyces avenae]
MSRSLTQLVSTYYVIPLLRRGQVRHTKSNPWPSDFPAERIAQPQGNARHAPLQAQNTAYSSAQASVKLDALRTCSLHLQEAHNSSRDNSRPLCCNHGVCSSYLSLVLQRWSTIARRRGTRRPTRRRSPTSLPARGGLSSLRKPSTTCIDLWLRSTIPPRPPKAGALSTSSRSSSTKSSTTGSSHDGGSDIELYNKELEQRENPTWLNANWLFSECYLYRRISTNFSLSTHWKGYDVFARQKIKTFRSSRPAVAELAARYSELVKQLRERKGGDGEADKLLFREMCEICLWGNATDLSLLTTLSYEDIQKLQGSEARRAAEANILVNDLDAAFDTLVGARGSKTGPTGRRRVDIVLDNAGFELYVDLVLAGYLLEAGLATEVVLHPKEIPWFVSDVVPADFGALLNALANPKAFYETPSDEEALQDRKPEPLSEREAADMAFLFSNWTELYADGKIILRPNDFWTQGGSYWRLPAQCPFLINELKSSELVIFKGDLNYRKLTGDAAWDPTTPFTEAIGPMGPGSGVNVLALRTCKADVVVGLKPGHDEKLREQDKDSDPAARKWAWSGKYAVVSFSHGA